MIWNPRLGREECYHCGATTHDTFDCPGLSSLSRPKPAVAPPKLGRLVADSLAFLLFAGFIGALAYAALYVR